MGGVSGYSRVGSLEQHTSPIHMAMKMTMTFATIPLHTLAFTGHWYSVYYPIPKADYQIYEILELE